MASNGPTVSEVSIANQALTWLGQNPISSFNDASTTAEWMRNNYPFIRDAVLEERMWTFATARAVSITEDLDAWGVMYSHPKLANWVSVFRCYRNVDSYGNGTIDKTFRMEGGNVLSAYSTVYLWGVTQITDTGKFTPSFVQCLAGRIAADAAIPLTENRQLQADMWNIYREKLSIAGGRDGQQGGNEQVISNTLIDARAGGGY